MFTWLRGFWPKEKPIEEIVVPIGLKKRELSRNAKKDHLATLGVKGEEAKLILDQMYGPEDRS